jgi:TolA-binding protein
MLFFVSTSVFSNPAESPSALQKGLNFFAAGRFSDALHVFRTIIADPKQVDRYGDAYFWLSKTHIVLNSFDEAEKNLEYFLLNYEQNENYPEALYQKGRLLYLQKEYEKSIQVFYSFNEQFPKNPYVGNSYFWIGESLYALGHLEKAHKIYKMVIQEYPRSYKIDSAKYRASLIELKYREQELMKFLKWSHEEALKTLEEFQIREKTYEQAIAAYQKKLAEYAEAGTERKIEELTLDLREKEAEVLKLRERVSTLTTTIEELNNTISSLESRLAGRKEAPASQVEEDTRVTDEASVAAESKLQEKQILLSIKEKALALKEYYLNWLEEQSEN